MLIIRKAQMEALDAHMLESFYRRLARHTREVLPAVVAAWSDQRLRDAVVTESNRAKTFGFESERDVARFVGLSLALGPDFTEQPAFRWAHEDLTDTSRPAETRMNRIYGELATRHPAAAPLVAAWPQEAS
jgi:hypothetical protein